MKALTLFVILITALIGYYFSNKDGEGSWSIVWSYDENQEDTWSPLKSVEGNLKSDSRLGKDSNELDDETLFDFETMVQHVDDTWSREALDKKYQTLLDEMEKIENEYYRLDLEDKEPDYNDYRGQYDPYGLRQGIGKIDKEDGHQYIGHWKNDMRHGVGGMVFPGGEMYISEWAFDNPHGFGQFKRVDGYTYIGDFKVGEANGFGYTRFVDKSIHMGYYKGNVPHGFGIVETPQYRHEGIFVHGKKEGDSRVIDKTNNKVVFEGKYKDNRPWKAGWVSNKKGNEKKGK